jgi:hypothetical protein
MNPKIPIFGCIVFAFDLISGKEEAYNFILFYYFKHLSLLSTFDLVKIQLGIVCLLLLASDENLVQNLAAVQYILLVLLLLLLTIIHYSIY